MSGFRPFETCRRTPAMSVARGGSEEDCRRPNEAIGALARTGVGLDTNSDRKAYTALGPICVSVGFLGRGPEKPGYTLSPLTFNVW
jgi:hypothetical protein